MAKKSKTYFTPQGTYTRAQADKLLRKIKKVAAVQGGAHPESSEAIAKITSELSGALEDPG